MGQLERPHYILSPVREAAFVFCAHHSLDRKAWNMLNKLMEAAYDGQASLDMEIELQRSEAAARMQKKAVMLFGEDAYDVPSKIQANGN